jgi:adenosylhomocysteine nucleosidase
MIVALGSLQREAVGIIRSGNYVAIEAPEDFIAYRPALSNGQGGRSVENTLAVVLSGSGKERAGRAARWAIDEFSPEAVISFGFCGATRDHQLSGDIVIAAGVVDIPGTPYEWSMADPTDSLGPDRTLLLAVRTAVEVAGLDYHHGTVATVARVARTSGMKRWLGEEVNAVAVDTETHAIAEVASKAGIPWVSILSVLDPWDFDLPTVIDRVGSGPRQRGVAMYLKHLSKSPLNLSQLMRLSRSSKRASTSLTVFMAAFMDAHSALTKREQTLAPA